jgi:hypothetical protein
MPRTSIMSGLALAAASAAAAAIAAGVAEALRCETFWAGIVAAGFAAAVLAPVGFALVLAGRALWQSWRPTAAALPGARVAGAFAYAVLAAALVGAVGSAGTLAAASLTHVPRLAALTVGLFAVAGGLVAALVSFPAWRGLSALLGLLEGRTRIAAACAAALAVWISVVALAPGAWPTLATFALALVAAHILFARRRVLGVAVAAGSIALALLAVRGLSDAALREARSHAPVAGFAIDRLCGRPCDGDPARR